MQQTSLQAFDSIKHKLGQAQTRVLGVLYENPQIRDWTNSEIASNLSWSINRITGRVNELRQIGVLEESRQRECHITGYTAIAWRIKR
jgi:DNA-binding MarR family transcriptional regulator